MQSSILHCKSRSGEVGSRNVSRVAPETLAARSAQAGAKGRVGRRAMCSLHRDICGMRCRRTWSLTHCCNANNDNNDARSTNGAIQTLICKWKD